MSTTMLCCGVEDVAVVSAPETSLFVHSYLRHTHFLKSLIEISPSGQVAFNKQITINIPKNADLLTHLWLVAVRPGIEPDRSCGTTAVYWTNAFFHALVAKMDFMIGLHTAETRYGEYMELYSEITKTFNESQAEFTGKRFTVAQLKQDSLSDKRLYMDTGFWFTKNAGLAMPLLCVSLQSLRVQLYTRPLSELVVCEGRYAAPLRVGQKTTVRDCDLCLTSYATVIYLTKDERDAILERENEFLFEQVQTTGPVAYNVGHSSGSCLLRVPLDFYHLVRDLYWTVQRECLNEANNWFAWDGLGGQDPVLSVDLKLNAQSMFQQKPGDYFRLVEFAETENRIIPMKYIYKYSFGLQSFGTQPHGHVNFTKLDNNTLNLVLQPDIGPVCITVWGKGWNCMRFSNGIGGPLFY